MAKMSKGEETGTTMEDARCGRTQLARAVSCAPELAAEWDYLPPSSLKGDKELPLMDTQWGLPPKSEEGLEAGQVQYGKCHFNTPHY